MMRRGSILCGQIIFSALWDIIGWCLIPILVVYGFWRIKKGKELPGRLKERFGFLSAPQRMFPARKHGKILWLHAASVGEMRSALSLIDALLDLDKSLTLVLTTMTVTGYDVARSHPAYGKRLIHAFLPYDTPLSRGLFLRHWRPVGAVFIESDLWPGLIRACDRHAIAFMLVNARLSEQSVRNWSHFKNLFQTILSPITPSSIHWVIPRSHHDQEQFQKLGISVRDPVGDLKEDTPPLPADPDQLAFLNQKIGKRPVFIAVSTHEGEEEIIISALQEARLKEPTLLGLIAPRHPERGLQLARHYNAPRRALKEIPGPSDPLWIIDTLGEMGLFLQIARSAFIGKSLLPPGGGHNPFEPLKAGCRVACGPYMSNWIDACQKLDDDLHVIRNTKELTNWIVSSDTSDSCYIFKNKNISFCLACQIITTFSLNK